MTKDILYKLYVTEQKTAPQIGRMLGVSSGTIYNYLIKHGIPRRDNRKAQSPIDIDKNKLIDLYVKQHKPIRAISKIIGVSEEVIRRYMIKEGVQRRDKTINFGGQNKGVPMSDEQKQGLSKTKKEYYQNNKHWNKDNITPVETRRKISKSLLGEREPAPSYYGGNWRMQRTLCIQRDNHTCQQCGDTNDIEVHHWEPYRFSYDNSLDNLVVLCVECHRGIHVQYRKEGFIKEAEAMFHEKA